MTRYPPLVVRRSYGSLLIFAVMVAAAASTGALFEPGEWYEQLNRPSWTPPDWLFPVAWTALYAGIALAGWLVWRRTARIGAALCIWGAQLVFNALWSWLFFGLHRPGLALIDIVAMLTLILTFIVLARRHSVLASWLFAPYAAWVTFAGALNFAIWRLN